MPFTLRLSCSKSSVRTPLGPTVKYGVNASPFAALDAQDIPTQPIGKHTKDGDEKCPVVLGRRPVSQKGLQKLHHETEHFFRREEKTPPARCLFFFPAFLISAPVARVFLLFGWLV